MAPFRQMAVFVAVADAGGFTAAARKLAMPTSVVSRMVSQLERELGVSLFLRSTRQIRLTDAGATYYTCCARMVEEADQACAALHDYQAQPSGELRVSAAFGLASHIIPAIATMAREHPALGFDLRLEDRYADLVTEGVDVAIRGGAMQDSTLIARALAIVRYVVCASHGYVSRHGVPLVPADLTTHTWIGHDGGPSASLAATRGGEAVRVALNARFRVNSGLAVLELLRSGEGVSLAPLWEVEADLRAGSLCVLLADWEFKRSAVYMVCARGSQRLPKVAALTRHLEDQFGAAGWDRVQEQWMVPRPAPKQHGEIR